MWAFTGDVDMSRFERQPGKDKQGSTADLVVLHHPEHPIDHI